MCGLDAGLTGALIGFGAGAAAVLLLSRSVWARDDFDVLYVASALVASLCFRIAQTPGVPDRTWLAYLVLTSAQLTAVNVAIFGLAGAVMGAGTLETREQFVACGLSAAVGVLSTIATSRRWGVGRRAREAARQERIAQLRLQAGRDIDLLVADAKARSAPNPLDTPGGEF